MSCKKYCLIPILCILLYSCNVHDKQSTFIRFVFPTEIIGEVIEIDLSMVMYPNYNMFFCRHYLVFADSKSDFWIKIIDPENQTIIAQFAKKGRGPDEVNFVYGLSKVPGADSLFYINDAPNKQILLYNINEVVSGKARPKDRIQLKNQNMIREITPINNKQYLSENLTSTEYFLALYDEQFNIISRNLLFPNEILDNLNLLKKEFRGAVFSPQICFNNRGDRFFCYLQNTDFLELFSLNTDTIESIYIKYSYLPEYVISSPLKFSYTNLRGGFLNCTCTDSLIYCLAHNNSDILGPEDMKYGGDLIYIFNWDGSPVRLIKLDRSIFHFAVDQADKSLYAFTYGEENLNLIRYSL